MKARAAVAWEAGKPLEIEEVDVAAPKEGRKSIHRQVDQVSLFQI